MLIASILLLAACGDSTETVKTDDIAPASTGETTTTGSIAPGTTGATTTTGYCEPSGNIPTPVVRSGASSVEATVGAIYFDSCNGVTHSDGPLILGAEPVLLAADGDIAVEVPPDFAVGLRWTGGGFTDNGDGSHTASQPPVGCHQLSINVDDPASATYGYFAVMVSVGDVDCAEPPPIEGFKLLGIYPTSAAIAVGETIAVEVDIKVLNPPEGYFCPVGRVVEGTSVASPDFVLGCTAGGNGDALMEIVGIEREPPSSR